ncbi:MAG: efflux RND transporter periplasmic adaptor subunit, partial [Planctomycetia bacterium]|nr:efflux RND transporter periplasmic adaptor subunit [Planctomycetia bacterium]
MRNRGRGWRYGLLGVGLLGVLAAVTVTAYSTLVRPFTRKENGRTHVPTATVRRTDLVVSMTAGGRVDSSSRTVIECELEALSVGVQGRSVAATGASTLLSIIPDGSAVKKGDILAVLDASDYEELLRTQVMNVDRARADHRQAELNLEVARLAVGEYRDGTMIQTLNRLEGQIALAKSDAERARARLAWTRRMLLKGYSPKSQVSTEEYDMARQQAAMQQGLTTLRLFQRFGAPMYLKILDSDVKSNESLMLYQDLRLQRHEARLVYLKKQVERCTIRAPRDGFVIHANEDMRATRIEPGISVRQRQRLFYLPDLTRMEVATLLHESVAQAVRPGMRARVRIEAMQGRELEGHVKAVSQLPAETNFFSPVKYFTASVQLDSLPKGLMPGMSAAVEIETLHKPDVLAIPSEALTSEGGRDICYVAHADHLERREVKVGQATRDLLEVTSGLDEGDEVVLDPTHADDTGEPAFGDAGTEMGGPVGG